VWPPWTRRTPSAVIKRVGGHKSLTVSPESPPPMFYLHRQTISHFETNRIETILAHVVATRNTRADGQPPRDDTPQANRDARNRVVVKENLMPIIARYPKRTAKKVEVDPDKPCFSVAEVSVLLGCSRWTVIRLFENEPGALILLRPETMHKRRRRMIRIPRAVYLRVRARMDKAGKFLC